MKKFKKKVKNLNYYLKIGDYVMENIDKIQNTKHKTEEEKKETIQDFLHIYIGDNYANIENCIYLLYLYNFVKEEEEEEEKKNEIEITDLSGKITKYRAENNKEVDRIVSEF